jgi:hypothetical protein
MSIRKAECLPGHEMMGDETTRKDRHRTSSRQLFVNRRLRSRSFQVPVNGKQDYCVKGVPKKAVITRRKPNACRAWLMRGANESRRDEAKRMVEMLAGFLVFLVRSGLEKPVG